VFIKEVKLENENVFGILRGEFCVLYEMKWKKPSEKIIDENKNDEWSEAKLLHAS
jgi:hypothetical protein